MTRDVEEAARLGGPPAVPPAVPSGTPARAPVGTGLRERVARIARSSPAAHRAIELMVQRLAELDLGNGRGAVQPPGRTAYSPEMVSPATYFEAAEDVVESFDDLHAAIQRLVRINPTVQLLWRGQRDASWGLHSALYRALVRIAGVHPPDRPHRASEPYPTEEDMVRAERAILDVAHGTWRMDGMNALECFARLQHYGAPTRLLDVSRNPYVAAWFAVEADPATDGTSGRLFALATHPVPRPGDAGTSRDVAHLRGEILQGLVPFWHAAATDADRQELQWGTGAIRRYWVPPVFEQRILAQNGAFVVDGVPLAMSGLSSSFPRPGPRPGSWRRADLLAASSIYTKVYSTRRAVPAARVRPFPPTFTFRITPAAKVDIRRNLEDRFAHTEATTYPDVEGLARHLRRALAEHLQDLGPPGGSR